MELGLREWMILIGGVLILAVVIDGIRRMQKARKNSVKLSRKAKQWNFQEDGDDTTSSRNSELPTGQARVVTREDIENEQREQAAQQEQDDAPILMSPVRSFESIEPAVEEPQPEQEELNLSAPVKAEPEPEEFTPEPQLTTEQAEQVESVAAESHQVVDVDFEEVFVINVLSKDADGYSGAKLLEILLACDVRFGDMDIFHRKENKGKGSVQFSVANMMEPGTFNLDGMRHLKTPGIAFFMRLPGPTDAMAAFDAMTDTAECIVRNLGGEMRDQGRSVMTKQTIGHYREQVREFERRVLAAQRA